VKIEGRKGRKERKGSVFTSLSVHDLLSPRGREVGVT